MAGATTTVTTQGAHPWRATVRTLVQAGLGLAAAAPLIYAAATQADPATATGAAATVLTVTGAVTRVMALPAVETWLRAYLPWLAAEPRG